MKKVLLIAYYFPPAGGSAVQRILGMARHLPAHGWRPTVLTAHPDRASWPAVDPALEDDVPADLEIVRVSGADPYAAYTRWTGREASFSFADASRPGWKERAARWIRANVFVPDARIGWSLAAAREAVHLAESRSFDAILTSGPPHSVHVAGSRAARRTGGPWVADLRDAWPDPNYAHHLPATAMARSLDRRIREKVLGQASAAVTVSRPIARALHGLVNGPVTVVENGFEEGDFRAEPVAAGSSFELLFVGTMPAEQNPEALWQALSSLRAEGAMPNLSIRLVGSIDARVRSSLKAHALDAITHVEAPVPHADAVHLMAGAGALLLTINRVPGAEGITTGKLYEYVGSGRPVVGIGPVPGEAARVLDESGAGTMVAFDDVEVLRHRVHTLYAAWAAGHPLTGAPTERAAAYTRYNRASEMAAVLDAVVPSGPPNFT